MAIVRHIVYSVTYVLLPKRAFHESLLSQDSRIMYVGIGAKIRIFNKSNIIQYASAPHSVLESQCRQVSVVLGGELADLILFDLFEITISYLFLRTMKSGLSLVLVRLSVGT